MLKDKDEYCIIVMHDDIGPISIPMPKELVEKLRGRSDRAKRELINFWMHGVHGGMTYTNTALNVEFKIEHLPLAT